MIFSSKNKTNKENKAKWTIKIKNKTDKQTKSHRICCQRKDTAKKKIKDCACKLSEESPSFQKEKWILVINTQGEI